MRYNSRNGEDDEGEGAESWEDSAERYSEQLAAANSAFAGEDEEDEPAGVFGSSSDEEEGPGARRRS